METYVIELVRDVTNPEPDRRSKDWHKLPVIKAGTRLIVRPTAHEYSTISSNVPRGYAFTSDRTPVGKAVLANAYQVRPESWYELAEVTGAMSYADSLLEDMLTLKRISRADFEAVAQYQREEGEREAAAEAAAKASKAVP